MASIPSPSSNQDDISLLDQLDPPSPASFAQDVVCTQSGVSLSLDLHDLHSDNADTDPVTHCDDGKTAREHRRQLQDPSIFTLSSDITGIRSCSTDIPTHVEDFPCEVYGDFTRGSVFWKFKDRLQYYNDLRLM